MRKPSLARGMLAAALLLTGLAASAQGPGIMDVVILVTVTNRDGGQPAAGDLTFTVTDANNPGPGISHPGHPDAGVQQNLDATLCYFTAQDVIPAWGPGAVLRVSVNNTANGQSGVLDIPHVTGNPLYRAIQLAGETPPGFAQKVFALAPGYVAVGTAMTDTGITAAADLLAAVPGATTVWRWDAATQAWQHYSANPGGGNFAIAPGDACLVAVGAGGVFTLEGVWAAGIAFNLKAGYNFLSLPTDQAPITSAAALLAAVPNALGVWHWDAVAQRWRGWLAGFGGDNFALSPGDPVLIAVSAPAVWPQ